MQNPQNPQNPQRQNLGRIKSVMGVTGSSRPCTVPTCGGVVRAFLQKYDEGQFRLIFSCERCHIEAIPGVTEAVLREPEDYLAGME